MWQPSWTKSVQIYPVQGQQDVDPYRTDMNLIGRDGRTDGRDGRTDAQTTLAPATTTDTGTVERGPTPSPR
jgi:hypothetical protein